MIRLFLALPLPEEEALLLWDAWETLRFSSPRIRWIPAEQYHMTLLFFGDLQERDITVLSSVMDEAASLFPPLKVKSEGPGQFPAKGSPRVFIEHFSEQNSTSGQLASLQHFLYSKLKDSYSLEKRKFRAHVTTARIGRNFKLNDQPLPSQITFPYCENSCILEDLVLFESILKPEGAEYIPRYSVKLEG